MVRVEKVRGNRVNVRGIGHFEIGDEEDVSPSDAEYLVEERGDFEYVDEPPDADSEAEAVETADATNDTVTIDDSTTSSVEVTTDTNGNDEEVEAPETASAVEGSEHEVPADEPPIDPSDLTVDELESELDDSDFSEGELLAIYSAEREAEDRTTAVDAIDSALEALEG